MEILIEPLHVPHRDAVLLKVVRVTAGGAEEIALDPPHPETGALIERERSDAGAAGANNHHAARLSA